MENHYTDLLQAGLVKGQAFSQLLAELRFSDNVVTQVALSELHGNTGLSLAKIEEHLANLAQVKKKLIEVATYPFVLLTFLILIMLGLKNYLIPQMEEGNLATQLISQLPIIFLGTLVGLLFLFLAVRFWYKKGKKIQVFSQLARLPFLGPFVQLYLTAYYAGEWGNLLSQGLEMDQIVRIMQDQPSALFREMGKELETAFLSGTAFHEQLTAYPFFTKELSLMVEYGQVKDKLGTELSLYSKEKWEAFFTKINQSMQLIQPIIFLLVAVMILLIYAAMLLPIYQNMEI